jgi:hypothetical protein
MNLAPFLTNPEWEPDFSERDNLRAIREMRWRNTAIQKCIDGKLSADDLLDVLEATGLDPIEYVEAVEGAVSALII